MPRQSLRTAEDILRAIQGLPGPEGARLGVGLALLGVLETTTGKLVAEDPRALNDWLSQVTGAWRAGADDRVFVRERLALKRSLEGLVPDLSVLADVARRPATVSCLVILQHFLPMFPDTMTSIKQKKLVEQLRRYRDNPARAKKDVTEARHAALDAAIAEGKRGDEALYAYMKEHHSDLIRKGRKDFISPASMMKGYHRSRRPG
jgi:hypothetical protein